MKKGGCFSGANWTTGFKRLLLFWLGAEMLLLFLIWMLCGFLDFMICELGLEIRCCMQNCGLIKIVVCLG